MHKTAVAPASDGFRAKITHVVSHFYFSNFSIYFPDCLWLQITTLVSKSILCFSKDKKSVNTISLRKNRMQCMRTKDQWFSLFSGTTFDVVSFCCRPQPQNDGCFMKCFFLKMGPLSADIPPQRSQRPTQTNEKHFIPKLISGSTTQYIPNTVRTIPKAKLKKKN